MEGTPEEDLREHERLIQGGDEGSSNSKSADQSDSSDNEAKENGTSASSSPSSVSSSDDEAPQQPPVVYDFDIMLAKKKQKNANRRRNRNCDLINDNDDNIAEIINQMKAAVEADFTANNEGRTATNKLKLLPFVVSQLRKVDLRDAFLDSGVLSVLTDWLTPLPDRSLPHLHIRENVLKLLLDFNICDTDKIRASGIGKAVMYLSKHPKEVKENKKIARQLISDWARPIFQLDLSYDSLSREEREERDLALIKNRPSTSSVSRVTDSAKELKPGDKGYVPRARVPAPSTKDYLIRPKSTIEVEISRRPVRQDPRLRELVKRARR
ncbi:Protein IWS1-like protein, partial [Fragariocoptes setiger]